MSRGSCKVASDGLERAAGNISDIVNNTVSDNVYHLFRLVITAELGFKRLFVECGNNVTRTYCAESFYNVTGSVFVGNCNRNDKKVCITVYNTCVFIIFRELGVGKNTEVVVRVSETLR